MKYYVLVLIISYQADYNLFLEELPKFRAELFEAERELLNYSDTIRVRSKTHKGTKMQWIKRN